MTKFKRVRVSKPVVSEPEPDKKDTDGIKSPGPEVLLSAPMSGEAIAAQLRQAAQQLGPVISNLDQQKSELLLKEVEKLAEHLRKLANLICEACALGNQKNLFETLEKLPAVGTEEETPRLAKTLYSQDAPETDQKSLAAGEKKEPFIALDARADGPA